MIEKIKRVLDERVRPALRSHGGDIEAIDYEDGVFRFSLAGRCTGCPGADLTTESLIEKELFEAIPGIKKVVLVQKVSEDLLEQARQILSRRKEKGTVADGESQRKREKIS